MNAAEIYDRFPTEGSLIEALIEAFYGSVLPCCRHCGECSVQRIDLKKFRCRACGRKFSVFAGTLFEKTRVDLRKWLYAIIKVSSSARKGISSCELARDIGVRQSTAWKMLSKIRKAMGASNARDGQLYYVVEADEVYLGGKPRKKNCKWKSYDAKPKTPVVTLVERPADGRSGRARLFVTTPDRKWKNPNAAAVQDIIMNNVDVMRSELNTDQSPLYYFAEEKGFIHNAVPHWKHYVAPGGHLHCNTAESVHAVMKRMFFGTYHKMERVQEYADELSFRWSNRERDGLENLMELALTGQRGKGR